MKKLRYSTFGLTLGKLSLIVSLILLAETVSAQSRIELEREILVYIQPQIMEFPPGERDAVTLDRLQIISESLRQALSRFNIQSLAKAFPDFSDSDTVRTAEDGRQVNIPRFSRVFRIVVPDESVVDSVISVLSGVPGVLFAEKHMDGMLFADPTYGNQWHLNNTGQSGGTAGADIKAEQAWQIFTGSSSIKVGVFDTGVENTHTEFSGKYSGDSPDASGSEPYWSHGTHVAGIAVAKANNDVGGRGVDWNAAVNSRKIFSGYGGYLGDVTVSNHITNAVNEGVHVLNHSWGGSSMSTTVRMAFSYAYKMNRVSCAAMGNDGGNYVRYPAALPNVVIAVGATQNNDVRSPFSNYANHIDVAAPGGYNPYPDNDGRDIWSSWRGNSYRFLAGTSMATPIVTGLASLLKGYNSSLSNDDIKNVIRLSADDKGPSGWDWEYGYGRVNAKKALDRLNPQMYSLTQSYTVGGTDQGASSIYQMTIYGAQALGLQDGNYWVKRHEIRKSVTYTNTSSVAVWGRGALTNGWANEGSVNFTYGFCEPVPGTVTSTGATLRTYVYEVFTSSDGSGFLGWYPTPPSNVRYEYTVHGIAPLAVSISGPSTVYHTCCKGQPANCYTWTADVSGGTAPYTYAWSKDGYSLGVTTSSYQECFSFNGWSGGSYQFTLRVDVTDAQSSTAYATKTVTAYNSTGGPEAAIADFEEASVTLPDEFSVSQNYPNPFNPETEISFGLPEPSLVRIVILDVLGREIMTLADREYAAGYQKVFWRGTDGSGVTVGSGVYFYRITAIGQSGKQFTKVVKMALTK